LEKVREREREKERERFIRERKEREEKERRERDREREQLERERLERERIERERKERERLEAERMERERQERERLEQERLNREARIEAERLRLERERLERERIDRERDRRSTHDRNMSGMKRPANSDYRYTDSKRSYRDEHHHQDTRKPFFGGASNPTGSRAGGSLHDDVYDMAYRRNADTRSNDREYTKRTDDTRRRDSRGGGYEPAGKESSDIRRVVDRYPPPSRERSPHRPSYDTRGGGEPRYNEDYERRDRAWLDAPNPNAPKTLSDVLGRAGLTGILGPQAESKRGGGGYHREANSGGYGGATSRSDLPQGRQDYREREPPRDITPPRRAVPNDPFKHTTSRPLDDRRVVRPPERRDSRENYRENERRESRPEERRDAYAPHDRKDTMYNHNNNSRKENYSSDHRKDSYANDRKSFDRKDPYAKDAYSAERKTSYITDRKMPPIEQNNRFEANERRDEPRDRRGEVRRDSRGGGEDRREERREPPRDVYRSGSESKPIDRGINRPNNQLPPPPAHSRGETDRRGLHPLAAELTARGVHPIVQPQHATVPGVFGRPLPAAVPGLPAPYGVQASQAGILQVAPSIQLRDGRLEFTRVAPPGANIQPFPRRF